MILVNCDALRRFCVDTRLLALLTHLDGWRRADELQMGGRAISEVELKQLVDAGLIETTNSSTEADGAEVTYWNPYDLAVHRQTNVGGYRESEVRSRGEPPPAHKARPDGVVTELPKPAFRLDPTLDEVLAGRRSIRTYGTRPVTLFELSTLLFHAARVTRVATLEPLGDHAFRPFPGGGARSELEIYVVSNNIAGLVAGAYYYDPRAHDIILIRTRDSHQARLNRSLHMATQNSLNRDPPVALVITAVFARVMWKYSGIGLGIIYKDTGCLYQTLYLVATAIGLAPCGIGGGEELANSRWLGLDPLVESQVGCVLIGPRVDDD